MDATQLDSHLPDWEELLDEYARTEDRSLLTTLSDGFDALCDAYLQATADEREAMRQKIGESRRVRNALLGHVHRAARRIESPEDARWLRVGLAAASIEDNRTDFRDTYVALGALYLAAAKADIDPVPHFRAVGDLSSRTAGDGQSMRAFIRGFNRSAYFRENVESRLAFIAEADADALTGLAAIEADNADQLTELAGVGWGSSMLIPQIAWSPDGSLLGMAYGSAVLYDVANLQAEPRRLTAGELRVGSVAFDPSGSLVAAGAGSLASNDGAVYVWELETGDERAVLTDYTGSVSALAFSPDGDLLATRRSAEPGVRLWDVRGNKQQATFGEAGVHQIVFSPDGSLLAGFGRGSDVWVWDWRQNRLQWTLSGHEGPLRAVAFSPDSRVLASAARDQTVRLWDVTSGQQTGLIEAERRSEVRCVAFNPSGSLVVSGGADRSVKLWNAETHAPVAALKGHSSAIGWVAFNPDGTLLASNSMDGTLRLWGVRR